MYLIFNDLFNHIIAVIHYSTLIVGDALQEGYFTPLILGHEG